MCVCAKLGSADKRSREKLLNEEKSESVYLTCAWRLRWKFAFVKAQRNVPILPSGGLIFVGLFSAKGRIFQAFPVRSCYDPYNTAIRCRTGSVVNNLL